MARCASANIRRNSGVHQGSGVAFLNGADNADKTSDGKFILSNTWFVTNAHVVKNAKECIGYANKGLALINDLKKSKFVDRKKLDSSNKMVKDYIEEIDSFLRKLKKVA